MLTAISEKHFLLASRLTNCPTHVSYCILIRVKSQVTPLLTREPRIRYKVWSFTLPSCPLLPCAPPPCIINFCMTELESSFCLIYRTHSGELGLQISAQGIPESTFAELISTRTGYTGLCQDLLCHPHCFWVTIRDGINKAITCYCHHYD